MENRSLKFEQKKNPFPFSLFFSPLDFAPNHAGAIFAVTNTIANLSGFLAPQTTGHLLNMDNSLNQWQLAFWISAMVYVPGFVLFQIWGTDQIQEWN